MATTTTGGLDRLGIAPRASPAVRALRWGGAALAVAALVAGAGAWIASARAPRAPAFETARVEQGDLVATVVATGTLRATNTVTIGSEVSGRVERVAVEPNDEVHVGDVLLELDPDQLEAQVREARANVSAASAALRVARATSTEATHAAERADAMHERGLVNEAEWEQRRAARDRAEADVASAAARLEVARAALERAEVSLSRAVIRSPVEGVVLTRSVEPGQSIASQFQTPVLFEVAEDLRRMRLRVDVAEADVGRVRDGQEATFTVDAYPTRTFSARIVRVDLAPQTTQGIVTYVAILDVDNGDRALRPGMTATATIVTETSVARLLLPNEALRWDPPREGRFSGHRPQHVPEGPHVWTLEGTEPRALSVRVLATDGTRSAIAGDGVEAGLEVIVGVAETD
jgi:HlyD family secretion protein